MAAKSGVPAAASPAGALAAVVAGADVEVAAAVVAAVVAGAELVEAAAVVAGADEVDAAVVAGADEVDAAAVVGGAEFDGAAVVMLEAGEAALEADLAACEPPLPPVAKTSAMIRITSPGIAVMVNPPT